MTEYPIRIRIGSQNAGDPETQTYTDSSFAEAVKALQGSHDGDDSYHRDVSVYVVATYGEETHVPAIPHQRREMTYRVGEPVFRFGAQVYGRQIAYGGTRDAQPSWASMGSTSVEDAKIQMSCIQLAIQLAEAANAEPPCPGCAEEMEKRQARQARIDASK
jgi:hypothetical protein